MTLTKNEQALSDRIAKLEKLVASYEARIERLEDLAQIPNVDLKKQLSNGKTLTLVRKFFRPVKGIGERPAAVRLSVGAIIDVLSEANTGGAINSSIVARQMRGSGFEPVGKNSFLVIRL